MAERCGRQNTAEAFSTAVFCGAGDQSLALSQGELEVVRRPARHGLSLLMLAIVVLADSLELFLFFFIIPQY
jgi:hypothetical protein